MLLFVNMNEIMLHILSWRSTILLAENSLADLRKRKLLWIWKLHQGKDANFIYQFKAILFSFQRLSFTATVCCHHTRIFIWKLPFFLRFNFLMSSRKLGWDFLNLSGVNWLTRATISGYEKFDLCYRRKFKKMK